MIFDSKNSKRNFTLDRRYLEAMKPKLIGCPNCGKTEGLKVKFDCNANEYVYCKYKIECTNCGYEQSNWHDNIVQAVKLLDIEARKKLDRK